MNAITCIGEQDKRLDIKKYFWFALPATSCTIRAKQSTTTEIFINILNILVEKIIWSRIRYALRINKNIHDHFCLCSIECNTLHW